MFNLFMLPLVIFLAYVLITRSKYQNRKGAGAFFFEDDKMVLNSALPYPISISDIDHVELKYNSWELEQTISYNLFIKVVRKNNKSKTVFYRGYGTAKLAYPADMAAALDARGIRFLLIDG